jgi:3-methyladenine DNA glycosylase/8-oxoguanine DNA glycosylase
MMNQTITQTIEEAVFSAFDFEATAQAHGWLVLSPFQWRQDSLELSRTQRLSGGQVAHLRMQASQNGSTPAVRVEVETANPLTPAEEAEIRRAVRRMLRLDENLTEFYQLAAQFPDWNLRLRPGGGRLLRCPTLFEDIVYTLCTTNISWSGTIRMVERLTTRLGQPFPGQP